MTAQSKEHKMGLLMADLLDFIERKQAVTRDEIRRAFIGTSEEEIDAALRTMEHGQAIIYQYRPNKEPLK